MNVLNEFVIDPLFDINGQHKQVIMDDIKFENEIALQTPGPYTFTYSRSNSASVIDDETPFGLFAYTLYYITYIIISYNV